MRVVRVVMVGGRMWRLTGALVAMSAVVSAGCSTSSPAEGATATSAPMATSAPATTEPPRSVDRPEVGECRRDGSARTTDRGFDLQPTVSCDEPHALETWRVGELTSRWTDVPELPARDSDEEIELFVDMDEACGFDAFYEHLGLSADATPVGELYVATPIVNYPLSPSPQQWRDGARWVRCDLGFIWDERGEPLTGSLAARADGGRRVPSPVLERSACLDVEDMPVPCERPHAVELLGTWFDVPGAHPDEDPAADAKLVDACWQLLARRGGPPFAGTPASPPASGLNVEVHPSPVEYWDEGDRGVTCVGGYTTPGDATTWTTWTGTIREHGDRRPPPA